MDCPRKNTLAMLFFLISILCYLGREKGLGKAKKDKRSKRKNEIRDESEFGVWYWLSLLAFVLAMLSKGSAATLPAVLLWIVWWQRGRITLDDFRRTAPFFLIAMVLTAVNIWFQTHGSDEPIRTAGVAERLHGAGAAVWFYVSKALVPINLVFVYPRWHIVTRGWIWWMPLLAATAVTVVLWRQRRTGWGRPLLFAWGVFCTALVPMMGLADIYFMRYSLVADHYQHIAIIGVVTLVAAGCSSWFRRTHGVVHSATAGAIAIVVAILAFLTWQQTQVYATAIVLYEVTLNKNPDCWLAENNLGAELFLIGRTQDAIQRFQQALRLKPDYDGAYYNLGTALMSLGQTQEAIESFQQAVRIRPRYAEAYNSLGNAFSETGRPKQAIEHFQQALKLKPDYAQANYNLGTVLIQTGQLEQAIEHLLQALRLKPDYVEAYNNLGLALTAAGRPQEAVKYLEQALRLEANLVSAYFNLGNALAATGQFENAAFNYEQALRLQPNHSQARANLARVYAQLERPAEAIAAAQEALRLARSQGETDLVEQIDAWLTSYSASHKDAR